MTEQSRSIAYLGIEGSFSHQVALDLSANHPNYKGANLIMAETIADVCSMVVKGEASSGIVPTENSTDGPVNMGLYGLRDHPLTAAKEVVLRIRQTLYFQDFDSVQEIVSHPSALGQCRKSMAILFPNATYRESDSTSAAVKEAAENPEVAGIGSSIARRVLKLTDILQKIDDVHDSPFNATRFFVVDTNHFETPITGNDKTSIIVQTIDQPGGLFSILSALREQDINLSKIKSFGRRQDSIAFFLTVDGHQRDLPLNRALVKLLDDGVNVKLLGSYQKADYQPPQIPFEVNMDYITDRFKGDITNGLNHQENTRVVYTLRDRAGALTDSIEPFARRGIDLTEIGSLPTGKLGEYAFYLSFASIEGQGTQALDELTAQSSRISVL